MERKGPLIDFKGPFLLVQYRISLLVRLLCQFCSRFSVNKRPECGKKEDIVVLFIIVKIFLLK